MIVLCFATTREMEASLAPHCTPPNLGRGGHATVELPRLGKARALVTGISPVNAALSLGLFLGRHPDTTGAVNLGVAGSFDPEVLPLGAVVLPSSETWPEVGLHAGDGVDSRGIGIALAEQQGRRVWDTLDLTPEAAAGALGLGLNPAWPRVPSLTVAGVSATPERAATLYARHAALLENMEGFALALACLRCGLPFLQVRTVSNRVGARPPRDWDLDAALTGLGSALGTLLGQ
ncbi:MAG: futalosine hydrolase [Thermodesulfobacteriota bacterium]